MLPLARVSQVPEHHRAPPERREICGLDDLDWCGYAPCVQFAFDVKKQSETPGPRHPKQANGHRQAPPGPLKRQYKAVTGGV